MIIISHLALWTTVVRFSACLAIFRLWKFGAYLGLLVMYDLEICAFLKFIF